MSTEVTTTDQTVAPDSPSAPIGANAEQPAAPSDSGNSSAEQDIQQASFDKGFGAGRQREREANAEKFARLAELEEQAKAAELEGMTPEELLAKYKESQGRLKEFEEQEAQRQAKRAEALKAKANGLDDNAKAFVNARIDSGDLDTAEQFMQALPSSEQPKPSDPAAPPNNPSAPVGISHEVVEKFRRAANYGDVKTLEEFKSKYTMDALREADAAFKAQGK